MLTSECPVCRRPISRLRTFLRPVWSRWRCEGCGSRLGVSLTWRLIATVPWIALIVFMLLVLDIMSLGFAIGLPMLIAVGMANYMLLDRIIIIERCRFRCRGCGYDLRGQVAPTCPECGRAFDQDEIELMQQASPAAADKRPGRGAGVGRWVTISIVILLGLAVFVQGVLVFRARGVSSPPEVRQTQLVLDGLLIYAENNDGRAPRHALEHAGDAYLGPRIFLAPGSATKPASVPLGAGTLDEFAAASPARRGDITRSVIAALPEGVIAHRLGDFVFTHHGLDLAAADPDLWLVLLWPDPASNPPPATGERICVGLADGTVEAIAAERFAAALARQNRLRAACGLAPLPDPAIITHDAPAVR
ncbi:MAG: hypothetical protein SYC29_03265 [Planctomycetota bacterium]|nr:hypothetical protein [Planctomycetota bacterium]